MNLNALGLIGLLNFALSSALAWFVHVYCPERKVARAHTWVNSFIAAWSLLFFCWQLSASQTVAFRFIQLVTFFGMWVNHFFLNFVFVLTGSKTKKEWVLRISALGDLVFACAIPLNLLFTGVEPRFGLGYWPVIAPWFWPYMTFWLLQLVTGFLELFVSRNRAKYLRPNDARTLLYAFLIGYIGGTSTWPMWVKVHFPPHLVALVSVYVMIVAYAIVRRELLEIRVLIRQTLLYSMVSTFLVVGYFALLWFFTSLLKGLIQTKASYPPALSIIVVVILFEPVRMRVLRWIDRHYPRESLNPTLLREATTSFAHEIKRPLASITLPAELAINELKALERGLVSQEKAITRTTELLQHIISQSMEAGTKIEALRALSTHDRSRWEEFDLRNAVLDASETCADRIKRHSVGLDLHLGQEPLSVRGDKVQLAMAFENLIKNAVEAMSDIEASRERKLSINAGKERRDARVIVRDTGRGIPLNQIRYIFEAYYTTKGSAGMGIGLFLTRQIIEDHKGSISATSSSDTGLSVALHIPLSRIDY